MVLIFVLGKLLGFLKWKEQWGWLEVCEELSSCPKKLLCLSSPPHIARDRSGLCRSSHLFVHLTNILVKSKQNTVLNNGHNRVLIYRERQMLDV